MIRRLSCLVFAVSFLTTGAAHTLHAELVADFENLSPTIAYAGPGGGHYENGKNLSGSFVSGGATFANDYDTKYESWQGWSYSNTIDTLTAGYANQYTAYALPGAHGPTNYAIGYSSAMVDLPSAPVGAHITNTAYGALSVIYGDQFAKQFGGADGSESDWFLLTISGQDALGNSTGSVPFYLADYRAASNTDDYIIRDWTWVDLSDLGADTRTLQFSLTSSDNGIYGMNTPAYFALDNLTTVPEPGTAALSVMALLAVCLGWSLRRKQLSS